MRSNNKGTMVECSSQILDTIDFFDFYFGLSKVFDKGLMGNEIYCVFKSIIN